ncbi:hypothetical protein C8J57DRAFT_1304600 [Mycena rebaudengoi]|nr:hypothetical protein C8J57DRAFT_1304600 [Mycena rebaudengoi]
MAAPGLDPAATAAAQAAGAAALQAVIQEIKELFATTFIGFAVATTAYGISVLQTYLYYRNYPKDSLILKTTVGALWLFDTMSTILVAHSMYTYIVTNFGNLAVDGLIPWSFALENGMNTMTTITAQCFYAWQIWTVSQSIIVTGGILLIAFTSFGLAIYITVRCFRDPRVASLGEESFQSISGPVQGLAAACDIVITLALIWFLRSKRSRSGIRTTREMIDTLILFAVCRGILTAIAQIMFMSLNVALPNRTFWMPFHQVVGKLYVNSVIASLNVRRVVAGKGEPESTRIQLSKSTGGGTRTLPLEFMRPNTESSGSLGQSQDPYGFTGRHTDETKTEVIHEAF